MQSCQHLFPCPVKDPFWPGEPTWICIRDITHESPCGSMMEVQVDLPSWHDLSSTLTPSLPHSVYLWVLFYPLSASHGVLLLTAGAQSWPLTTSSRSQPVWFGALPFAMAGKHIMFVEHVLHQWFGPFNGGVQVISYELLVSMSPCSSK